MSLTRLSFEELSADAVHYDEQVLATPSIDRFCSSSLWILPAARHLAPSSEPFLFRSGDAYLSFARTRNADGTRVLHPLEAMWALASPVAGARPDELAALVIDVLSEERDWDVAFISGLRRDSAIWNHLVPALSHRYPIGRGPTTRRYLAALDDGVDGFLAARSSGFRKNLKKAEKRARAAGLRFEQADQCEPGSEDASFERLLRIERASWKGQRGAGIDTHPMEAFYRDMNRRLVARGARRLLFATIDGTDVAYILGGLLGDTYRGLQFSFDHRYRELSLGNLSQIEEIRRLCEAGVASYDLGTEVRYKKRWGERVFTTSSLFVQRPAEKERR